MYCPYAMTKKQITRTQMEYNAEGLQTDYIEVQLNKAEFVKCHKEECGAWHNERCCYKERIK